MNKKITVIFLIYFFQFLATSCVTCNCENVRTYERIYNDLELKAWDTSGFQNTEISDSVNKNSFGLTISVNFELNQIAYFKPSIDLSSLGFTSAYALSDCDCSPDQYINIDPIESIEILVTNSENQETTVITNNFSTYDYNGELITITKLFENRAEWHDGFQIELNEYNNIPNLSVFTIKIVLQSGTELIKQTQEITFE